MANPATVLGLPRADRLLIGLGVPAAGLLIGLLLPPLARWLVDKSPAVPPLTLPGLAFAASTKSFNVL